MPPQHCPGACQVVHPQLAALLPPPALRHPSLLPVRSFVSLPPDPAPASAPGPCSALNRRVALGNHVSLALTLDPAHPGALPLDCRFMGSDRAVAPLRWAAALPGGMSCALSAVRRCSAHATTCMPPHKDPGLPLLPLPSQFQPPTCHTNSHPLTPLPTLPVLAPPCTLRKQAAAL